ncbi:hypothetical protein MACH09_13220 [Vibrio sp. MACH09]|uniref:hypothetical protein n=1 Tax=unclassified Vibrio TaxID=2614977 RepID=UPI00149395F7|nr:MULTISPECIES: hypothetical protein [unclassified Vibrio]NOI68110.1 hypothetical protein [Vibrio sp. 99-8-1]GLO60814.1 hypothetical protein MACH09_13220 [Vibrio sp. MACH09]
MRKILLVAGLVLASSSVFAAQDPERISMSNFNYDYAEARIGADPVTFGGAYSKSIHPNAHAIIRADSKFKNDYNMGAGFGFHAPINNWADLTGEMLMRMVDDKNHSNDIGLELNIGVRQWLGPQLEVGGRLGYVEIDNDDDFVTTVFARFHSTELFSMGLEGKFNDFYGDQLMFTTRFKF